MVVDERYRRRGVGQRLTAERLAFIRSKADEAWYLVNRHNAASIDLHVAHGFHESTTDYDVDGDGRAEHGCFTRRRRATAI